MSKKQRGVFQKRPFALKCLFWSVSDRFGLFRASGNTAAAHGFGGDFGRAEVFYPVIAIGGVQIAVYLIFAPTRRRRAAAPDKEALIKIVQRDFGLVARSAGKIGFGFFLRLLAAVMMTVLMLALRLELRLMAVIFFRHFVEHALVMFGMLQIAFSQNTVARPLRIARQRQVFFGDLHRVATDADIGAVAVKSLDPGIDAAMAAVVVMVVLTAAVTVIIVVTAAKTSSVLIMSHMTHFAFYCPFSPCFRPFGTRKPPFA